MLMLLLPIIVICLVVWILIPELLYFNIPSPGLITLALLVVPLALMIEIAVPTVTRYLQTGNFPKQLKLQQFWQKKFNPGYYFLLFAIAVAEEFLYRQICFGIFEHYFNFPLWSVLVITSLMYGLNHLFFGLSAVFTKTLMGLIYGSLYIFGDHSILLPIIAHTLQNYIMIRMLKA